MSKIIDAHSHYMPPAVACQTAFFKVHWSDADRQLSVMDKLGIDRAMLLYPTSDAHLNMGGWGAVCAEYNPANADLVSAHPDRFIGGGVLPVDDPKAIPVELDKIQAAGLKVLSLASSYDGVYLDDERFVPVFEFAREHRMPVHVHAQIINPIGEERVRDPLLSPVLEYVFDVTMCLGKMMMSGTLTKFPDVDFIFPHYGGVLPLLKERFDNTYQMLRKREYVKDLSQLPSEFFKNLYFDTSGSNSIASLQCALEVADTGHILWGSDFPANQSIEPSISFLQDADISAKDQSAILFENAFRLLSIR